MRVIRIVGCHHCCCYRLCVCVSVCAVRFMDACILCIVRRASDGCDASIRFSIYSSQMNILYVVMHMRDVAAKDAKTIHERKKKKKPYTIDMVQCELWICEDSENIFCITIYHHISFSAVYLIIFFFRVCVSFSVFQLKISRQHKQKDIYKYQMNQMI